MAFLIRSDPYEDPDAILPQRRGRKSSKGNPKRDGFVPRDSRGSRIYEEPNTSRKQRPKEPSHPPPKKPSDDDDADDLPVELVRI